MRKTAILKDNLFMEHDPGFDHVESPERLRTLYPDLEKMLSEEHLLTKETGNGDKEHITLVHTLDHYTHVASTAGKVYSVLDADTFTSAKSFSAASRAVGCAVQGIDELMCGNWENCFSLLRPPGHHAEVNKSMGFCLFNNIAIAARYAQQKYGLSRILVLDWDVHHGNGTQNVFYDTDEILYISIHQSPLYPGTGHGTDTGEGKGKGFTLNIPLPGGQGDLEYANIFNTIIEPVVRQYQPQLILVSAGFDSHEADMISSMRLSSQGFAYMAETVIRLAEDLCEGKTGFFLEGGYNLPALKDSVFSVLAEMKGAQLGEYVPLSKDKLELFASQNSVHPAIEQVRDIAKKYWNM